MSNFSISQISFESFALRDGFWASSCEQRINWSSIDLNLTQIIEFLAKTRKVSVLNDFLPNHRPVPKSIWSDAVLNKFYLYNFISFFSFAISIYFVFDLFVCCNFFCFRTFQKNKLADAKTSLRKNLICVKIFGSYALRLLLHIRNERKMVFWLVSGNFDLKIEFKRFAQIWF